MPSDLRNSTMAKATGLTFSLFNIASAREVPFAILLYMQCILYGLTMALLCGPIHLCSPRKVSIARDDFHLLRKSSLVATKVLFEQ